MCWMVKKANRVWYKIYINSMLKNCLKEFLWGALPLLGGIGICSPQDPLFQDPMPLRRPSVFHVLKNGMSGSILSNFGQIFSSKDTHFGKICFQVHDFFKENICS